MTDSDIVQARGRDLAFAMLGAVRTLETHGPDNQAFAAALDRLSQIVHRDLPDLGEVLRLDIVDQRLLLNGTRLRAFGSTQEQLDQLVDVFARRQLGGLVFKAVVDPPTLRSWLACFVREPRTPEEASTLHVALAAVAPAAIETLERRTLTTPEHEETVRVSTMAYALQTYARTLLAHRDFVAALQAGRDPYANRLSVVRVVQDLIDVVAARADLLFHVLNVAITREQVRSYAEIHAANTTLYALLIGHVLRLDRTALLDLGTGALLADAVARAHHGDETRDPDQPWTEAERAHHRAAMARAVHGHVDLDGLDDALMIRTIVACERDTPAAEAPHLYSRITAVADAYDALTQRRTWRDGHSPAQALRTLLREPLGRFDPQVLVALECVLMAYLGVAA